MLNHKTTQTAGSRQVPCWKEELPREAEWRGPQSVGDAALLSRAGESGSRVSRDVSRLPGLDLSRVLQFETAALELNPMAFLGLLGRTALLKPLPCCEMLW